MVARNAQEEMASVKSSLMNRFFHEWVEQSNLWSPTRSVDLCWKFNWVAGFGFSVLSFLLSYPGRFNADSFFSLIASTTPGMTNNWHSATLEWFWSLPGPFLGQPEGALTMQAALFGIFAGFMPCLPAGLRGKAILAFELLLRVALSGTIGYIGKDAVMLITLLIAVQLLRGIYSSKLNGTRTLVLAAITTLFLLTKAPNFFVIVTAAALALRAAHGSIRGGVCAMEARAAGATGLRHTI